MGTCKFSLPGEREKARKWQIGGCFLSFVSDEPSGAPGNHLKLLAIPRRVANEDLIETVVVLSLKNVHFTHEFMPGSIIKSF
jgi:hypothetical protein